MWHTLEVHRKSRFLTMISLGEVSSERIRKMEIMGWLFIGAAISQILVAAAAIYRGVLEWIRRRKSA